MASNRRLVMLALAATTAMIMGTIAGPAIQLIFGGQLLGDIVTTQAGAAQLARLTALVAAMATCAWLGGLLALATVLIPGEKVQLDQLVPRFSRVAQLSVVTLIVTGIVHALALAGGVYQLAGSRYGLVLLIKVSIFGLMLLMGNEGRKYAARAAFRLQHQPPGAPLKREASRPWPW